jgi:hypothetical protein
MSVMIFEGIGMDFMCNGAIVGSKIETGFGNGGFWGEYGGGGGNGSGSNSNSIYAYYKKFLQAVPRNPLLLINCARFL